MIARASIVVGVLALVCTATAQEPPPAVPLASGFTPDPMRLTGRARGTSPLAARASSCRGFSGDVPDHRVTLETRFGFLRWFATAAEDVTMALRGPDGRWRCAGRRLDGAPREEGVFEPGEYEVWIGSLAEGREVPYELIVTEFQSVTPAAGRVEDAPIAGGAEIGLDVRAAEGRFRPRRFRRGFLPDPRRDSGEAGGEIDAGLLGGGCRGRVHPTPNHIVTLRTPFDYFRIDIANAPGVATLIVRTPEGGYYCSAPDDGLAFVENTAWTEGQYMIWVGTRASGDEQLRYRILYSEIRPAAR